jgi:NAD-dependent DNA ligase
MSREDIKKIISKKLLDAIIVDPHTEGMKIAISKLEKLLLLASHMYYNTEEELLSDTTFDILQNILKERAPSSSILKDIGSPVELVGKVPLPFWMGSADKIKPSSKELERWISKYKGPYLISSKLDGLSGLLVITSHQTKLYTRGDGKFGQDVSRLLDYITIPKLTIGSGITAIRGEIIIKKSIFNTKYKEFYPKARSLIAGMVNSSVKADSKSFKPEIAKQMEFIAYEVISYDNKTFTFKQQFDFLIKNGFTSAKNELINTSLSSDILSSKLLEFKETDDYEIDGIIIADSSKWYPRNESGNPDYIVAFKMSLEDQKRITKVVDIEWNASKHGILKPTVIFEAVEIGGDTIRRATGFNASFINENNLNIGSKIVIIKSGDVIPYIAEVSSKMDVALMPDKKGIKWKWNDSKVDAILLNAKDDINVIIKRIAHFMKTLGVVGVSEGVITRLYEAGYVSLVNILNVPIDSIASISGFSLKSATNIYKAIHSITDKPINLPLLMDASNCFEGFAIKKLELLTSNIPHILDKSPNTSAIIAISGFSDISANKILQALPDFKKWLNEHSMLKWELVEQSIPKDLKMLNQIVVLTGFRDDTISGWIESQGGKMGSSVSSKTTILLVKDSSSCSSKMEKAKELGITIMTGDEFKKKYKI